MALTLTGLPYDIKHSLLQQVNDRDTLLNLISTSRTFLDIFTRHKDVIINNLYLSEALNHAPDSIIFSYCRRTVLGVESMDELVGIARGYEKYSTTGTAPPFLTSNFGAYESRKLAKYLVEDYLGIRKIAMTHQYSIRVSRNEPALTTTELHRIMRSIYRGWTLLLLIHQRQLLLQQIPSLAVSEDYSSYDRHFIERIIVNWDFWSSLQIWELVGDNMRVLPTGTVDVRETKAFQKFNSDVKVSLLQDLFDGFPEKQALTLIFPVFRRVDSKPFTEARFALSNEFAEYLFIHHDPTTIAPLYALDPTPSPKVAYDRIATYLSKPVKTYLTLKYSLSYPDFQSLYAVDTFRILRGMVSKIKLAAFHSPHDSHLEDFYGSVRYNGEVPIMRLLERPVEDVNQTDLRGRSKELFNIFKGMGKMMSPDCWVKKAWLCNCLLDEWRLEGRGFEYPVFEDDFSLPRAY
ncbi:hypothetical protein TWF694_006726 [Orbilia ellipsospora]|uniref:F-box domain-containing protein n=1 Tax=Orbilia ellipsospora TaxID=2528407 RepID=A0AAV9XL21_9PEZI